MKRWCALGCIFVVACAGDDKVDPPPEAPGITLDALCAEVAAADCERIESCGLLAGPIDTTTCVTRQKTALCAPTAAALRDAVAASAVAYFELAARDCRSALRERSCDWGFDYDLFAIPACRGMFDARTAEGDTCHLSAACGDGLWCDPGTACPGTCRALLGNNTMCGFGDRCTPGLFCGATTRRCLDQVPLDAECELSIQGNSCRNGAFCDSSQPGFPVCRPVRGRGEGCQSANECIVGSRCVRNRCSAGEQGDTCDDPIQCNAGLACGGGRCEVPIDAGAECVPSTIPCRAGFDCVGEVDMEVCTALGNAGTACLGDGDCFLGHCANDLCVDALDDGADCMSASDCLPGRTCETQCTVVPRACAP